MYPSERLKGVRWYGLRRWRNRARYQMREHPLCAMCLKDNIVTPAYAADHVVPHRGDEKSFWFGALQSLCLAHHNITKQREEIDGFACNVDADGWPLDPRHPSNARD